MVQGVAGFTGILIGTKSGHCIHRRKFCTPTESRNAPGISAIYFSYSNLPATQHISFLTLCYAKLMTIFPSQKSYLFLGNSELLVFKLTLNMWMSSDEKKTADAWYKMMLIMIKNGLFRECLNLGDKRKSKKVHSSRHRGRCLEPQRIVTSPPNVL